MTHMRRVRTLTCVVVAITLTGMLLRGSTFATSANELRMIVTFKNLALKTLLGNSIAHNLVTTIGGSVIHDLTFVNALAIRLSTDSLEKLSTPLLSDLYGIEVIDDVVVTVDRVCPTDTLLPVPELHPWGLHQIQVPEVHRRSPPLQGSGVTVAVLDTGINSYHRTALVGEFSQGMAKGYNALASGTSPIDDHGHGTHIAGIIAATWNGLGEGIIGAAPQAKIAAVKVLDKNGVGYVSDVLKGLEWVDNQGIRLVNMSFGFRTDSPLLRQAIEFLAKKGVIMVASAGNRCATKEANEDGGGDDCNGGPAASCSDPLTEITYPAGYPEVLAVGATDIDGYVTAYSLSGDELDVLAPGGALKIGRLDRGQILSTNKPLVTPLGLVVYGLAHGTSQAAAHATGSLALALQLKPKLSLIEVKELLKATAVDLKYPPDQQGVGRIDAKALIENILP